MTGVLTGVLQELEPICLKSDPLKGLKRHTQLPLKHQLHQVLHPFCPLFPTCCHQLPHCWCAHLHGMAPTTGVETAAGSEADAAPVWLSNRH